MEVLISNVWMFPFVSVIWTRIEGLKRRFMLEVIIVTSIRHFRLKRPGGEMVSVRKETRK